MNRLLLFTVFLTFSFCGFAAAEKDLNGLLEQGYLETQKGQLSDAVKTLQSAVALAPESSLAHTRLGGVYVLNQSYRDGIESFQQAIMLDPSNSNAFVGMAVAYLHTGQFTLARAALDEAGKLDPQKQPEIDKLQAWIDQRAGKNTMIGH